MKITMAHGSGGKATSDLVRSIFIKYFDNSVLAKMEDAAVLPAAAKIAMTTDSFVVTPLFFPGGNIGQLAVIGTVNDLAMSGAVPKYLTCGFIIEEGADIDFLEEIVASMATAAKKAGVLLVAGDTKVIEGQGGIYINTAGVGFVSEDTPELSAASCQKCDAIILSGCLGDHHAAIMSARLGITNSIQSDLAPLHHLTAQLLAAGVRIRTMRDVTRGGLATVLHELATASQCCIFVEEESIPVNDQVRAFCGILGLDPLYMGNEGKMVLVVDYRDGTKALDCIRQNPLGKEAAIIGGVNSSLKSERQIQNSTINLTGITDCKDNQVLLHTKEGGWRILSELYGEGLPRIC